MKTYRVEVRLDWGKRAHMDGATVAQQAEAVAAARQVMPELHVWRGGSCRMTLLGSRSISDDAELAPLVPAIRSAIKALRHAPLVAVDAWLIG